MQFLLWGWALSEFYVLLTMSVFKVFITVILYSYSALLLLSKYGGVNILLNGFLTQKPCAF